MGRADYKENKMHACYLNIESQYEINTSNKHKTKPYQDALILYLLDEIDRAYWNKREESWDGISDPKIPGVTFRYYYFGEDPVERLRPNFAFDFSPQEVTWFRHPGRNMKCALDWTSEGWVEWFDTALEVINSDDA